MSLTEVAMASALIAGFWFAIAVGFLGLASAALHERDRLEGRQSSAGGPTESEGRVIDALRRMLLVELGAFLLAGAAAFVQVFG